MTVEQVAKKLNFRIESGGKSLKNEIESVYCCDLLSRVISTAPPNCAWVTIMSNINTVAVASLVDIACIVIADSVEISEDVYNKASVNEIPILISPNPIFDTAKAIDKLVEKQ